MKTINLILTFCFVAFISTFSLGQITGSAHDFSAASWNSTTGEVCNVCHTPHNALAVSDAPLWDHEVTVATFTLYTSSSMDATTAQPDGSSKLCLSCHDGTVALDNFAGNTTGSTTIDDVFANGNVGTDFSNDHPISFTYDLALSTADGELYDPTVATSGLGGTIDADMLRNHQVQCSSCHDVHNANGNTKLLVMDNAASALCLTCHDK